MTYTRMIVIAPVAELAGLRDFVTANIDPQGQQWFVESLSADGTAPATHGWACFQATDEEHQLWIDNHAQFVCGSTDPQAALAEAGLQTVSASEE